MKGIIESLPVQRIRPVLLLPFFARTFRDYSGYGNDGTPTGGYWTSRDGVDGYCDGEVNIAADSSLEPPDITIGVWGDFRSQTTNEYLFSTDDFSTRFYMTATQLRFATSGVNSARAVSIVPARSLLVTATAASAPPRFSIDGVFNGVGGLATAFAIGSHPLIVAGVTTLEVKSPVFGLIAWPGVLTAAEISAWHGWTQSLVSHRVSPNRQYWDLGSRVPIQQPDDVAAWDFGITAIGESADRAGNGHTATLENATAVIPSELGQAARLIGVDEFISVPDHADLSFGDGSDDSAFSVEAWVKLSDATSFPVISKGVYNTSGEWRMLIDASDKIHFQTFDESVPDCYIGRTYTSALTGNEGKWMHVVGTYDGSETSAGFVIYVNGVAVDDADSELNAGSYVAMESLASDVHIGRDAATYGKGLVKDARIVGRVLTAAEVLSRYRERASTVLFHETWELARPTTVNATAGMFLDGTRWQVETGTWKNSESATWKGPECVVAGKIRYVGTGDADLWTTNTFVQESGTPTLTKLSDRLEIDGLAGEKVGEIILTVG